MRSAHRFDGPVDRAGRLGRPERRTRRLNAALMRACPTSPLGPEAAGRGPRSRWARRGPQSACRPTCTECDAGKIAPRLHPKCRSRWVSTPVRPVYARNHPGCHPRAARKSLALNAIQYPAHPNSAAQCAMGRVGERPTGNLAVSGPGRCSSVTPAAPGRSPWKSSILEGCRGSGDRR